MKACQSCCGGEGEGTNSLPFIMDIEELFEKLHKVIQGDQNFVLQSTPEKRWKASFYTPMGTSFSYESDDPQEAIQRALQDLLNYRQKFSSQEERKSLRSC